MRTIITALLSIFILDHSRGQYVSGGDTNFHNLISVECDGFLYRYIPNIIHIKTNNIPIHKLEFYMEDSAYVTYQDSVYYLTSNYYPEIKLKVYDKLKDGTLRKLAVEKFLFTDPPDVVCYVANQKGEFVIPKAQMQVLTRVQTRCEWWGEVNYPALSFEMFARVNGNWNHFSAKGDEFTPEMKGMFAKLNKGDQIYIVRVKVKDYTSRVKEIKGVTITIE